LSCATPKEQIKRPFLSWKLALSFFMCQTLLLAEFNHTVVILEPPDGTFAHELNHSFFSFVDELGNHFLIPKNLLVVIV
jgi:hypothetical protein